MTLTPVEYKSDLVLGPISSSFVADTIFKRLVSSVQVSYPSRKMSSSKLKAAKASKAITNSRHSRIIPDHLDRVMNIGLDKAKQILKVTTQKGICTAVHPIYRRYQVDHLDLHSSQLAGKWYLDWIPTRTKSITQCTGAFVYMNRTFTEVYPSEKHTQQVTSASLNEFCNDIGIP